MLEAALDQHSSPPVSDGGSGHPAAAVRQPPSDTAVPGSQAIPPTGAAVPVAATAADGINDVMEALCCPITHVRHCALQQHLLSRQQTSHRTFCCAMASVDSIQPGRLLLLS